MSGIVGKGIVVGIVLVLVHVCTGPSAAHAFGTNSLIDTSWNPSPAWSVFTQADFEQGVLNQVDTSTNPNYVILAGDSSSWYDGAWGYRMPVTITNGGGAPLVNYQVKVTVDTQTLIAAGKMQADADDIRFTTSDGATEIPYWIESGIDTAATDIWVQVPNIPVGNSDIYIYYGNPSAAAASSASSTFSNGSFQDLFDDISLIDADDSVGTVAVTSGEVQLVVADTEVLDESQTQQSNNWRVWGNRYHAQTFEVDYSGFLTKVTIRTRTSGTPPNPLEVEIRNATALDEPGSIVYATASRDDIGATMADYDFNFDIAASVTAGTRYALVIKTVGGDNGNYYRSRYENSDAYPRGRRLTSADAGSSWVGTAQDLYFMTYITTASELDQSQTTTDGDRQVYGNNWIGQTFLAGITGDLTMVLLNASAVGAPPNALTVELRNAEQTIQEFLDQSQTSFNSSYATYGNNWTAQTFRAALSGDLSRVTLRASETGAPPNDLTVELRDVTTSSQENEDQNQTSFTGDRQTYGNNWWGQIFEAAMSGDLTKITLRASETGNPPNDLTVELRDVTAVAEENEDQSQTLDSARWNVRDGRYLGQTFQAGQTGDLTKVTLLLRKRGNPPNPITVEIRDCTAGDLPGSTVYASASLNPGDIGTAYAEYDFVFATPASVTAGVKYSIVISTSDGDNSNCYQVRHQNSDAYANGRRCLSTDAGSSWTGQANDLCFRTYVTSTAYTPGSTVHATASRSDVTVAAEYDFTYGTPYAVTAGTKYAIVVRTTGGDAANYYNVSYENSDAYANGRECSSIDGGSSWTGNNATDLYFRTWVTILVGGTPGSTVYASASRSDITIAQDYDFVFAMPYTITAETNYALVIYTTGGDAANCYNFFYQDPGDPYANGSGCSSSDGGSIWTPSATADAYFMTYVSSATGDYEPGDTVYAIATNSGIGSTAAEYPFIFAAPYTITSGTRYSIVVSTTGGDAANYYNVAYQSVDAYSNGNESTSVDAGTNWTNTSGDLYFETYVEFGQAVAASAILRSVTIPIDTATRFAVGILLSWNDTEPGSSDIDYQLEYYSGGAWQLIPDADLPGNSTGFDTSGVDISSVLTAYDQIRLRANLSSTYSTDVPSIQDWTVTYYYREYSSPEPTSGAPGGEETTVYVASGTIACEVHDTLAAGVTWDSLGWEETLPAGTSITFEVRASDVAFLKDAAAPAWQPAGALPITGRYQQWRATLSTAVTTETPVLSQVNVLGSHP